MGLSAEICGGRRIEKLSRLLNFVRDGTCKLNKKEPATLKMSVEKAKILCRFPTKNLI